MGKSESLTVEHSITKYDYTQKFSNISLFKEDIKASIPNISDYDLAKAVLLALDNDKTLIESLPKEKVLEALTYTSATRTKSYFKESSDGSFDKVNLQSYSSSNYLIDQEIEYGDIILTSTAYERTNRVSDPLDGRRYYTIAGQVDWVGFPNFQMTDILAVSSTGNIDNDYAHSSGGYWQGPFNLSYSDYAYLDDDLGGDGMFISVETPSLYGMSSEFPISVGLNNDCELSMAYVQYGITSQDDITCQVAYSHSIIDFFPSVSISISGDISFSGFNFQRQVFNGTAFTLYH